MKQNKIPEMKVSSFLLKEDRGQSILAQDSTAKNLAKVFMKTYGCQMNVYDSQRMSDILTAKGYTITSNMTEADLVLLNTCHIREKAAEKVYSDLGRIAKIKEGRKKEGKSTLIAVAGCVAQAEGEEIIRRAPVVNMVIGTQVVHLLGEALERAKKGERVIELDHEVEAKFKSSQTRDSSPLSYRGVAAFLTVQEGCDKFCSFCVVPYTRGAEHSRSVANLVDEAERLVGAGVREITLLGQNVNAWRGEALGGKKWGLARLLFRLSEISGLVRLRYTTSHPKDMDSELIEAHRDLSSLMPYLHLPVQSGSDRILKAMNRRYTVKEYRDLIDRIRVARGDIALSSDFIVGFPGETEDDFNQTMELVREVSFASAFSFKYSARPGTPSANMADSVPQEEKDKRLQCLQQLLTEQRISFSQALVGKKFETLLEKPGRQAGQIVGRSPWLQPVILDEKAGKIGDLISVVIKKADINSLYGERE